jgi:hypothetical protein
VTAAATTQSPDLMQLLQQVYDRLQQLLPRRPHAFRQPLRSAAPSSMSRGAFLMDELLFWTQRSAEVGGRRSARKRLSVASVYVTDEQSRGGEPLP